MANPYPEEKALYERLKNENVTINLEIWDMLYNRIGDDITAINLLCKYYLNDSKVIPVLEAKKILTYTHHIKDIVNKLTMASSRDFPFPEFLDDIPLHPVVRDMFTHYIGNDVYVINLIVYDSVDSAAPKDMPLESIEKILAHTRTIREFMNRLREVTLRDKNLKDEVGRLTDKGQGQAIRHLSKKEVFLKIRQQLYQEFKVTNEEMIKKESRFIEDLNLDSVDAIRVIMVLEDAFGIEIPDSDAERVFTVGEAVDYVYKRLEKEP